MKKRKNVYLTMDEMRELALCGKEVVQVRNYPRKDRNKNGFVAKIRNCIFDGQFLNKKMNLD